MLEIRTIDQFNSDVMENKDDLIIVDFGATWCRACVTLMPILNDISVEGKFKIFKIDVDEVPEIAQKYGIRGIPTLLYFKNGKIIKTLVGVQSKNEIEKI
jgi:thioredoxin 1